MRRKKAAMIVMNTLSTDARVQRAAKLVNEDFDLTVISLQEDSRDDYYQSIPIQLQKKHSLSRYIEFELKVKKKLKREKWDLVYVHDYYLAHIIKWIKRSFPMTKVVYDAHELIIPDRGEKLSKRDLFFYQMEKRSIHDADLVVCANEDRGRLMKDHYSLSCSPLIIENISELPTIEDDISEELIRQCSNIINSDDISLVYAGVLSKERKIEELIHIIKSNQNTNLLIIGDGPDSVRLKQIAEDQIPGQYYFMGSIPYKYLGIVLKKCDIGYISYPANSLNSRYCAPNKIYEYASVSLPMIAPWNPTLEKIFYAYNIGEIGINLEDAFAKVASRIEWYKGNCKQFSEENPWQEKAIVLSREINRLF